MTGAERDFVKMLLNALKLYLGIPFPSSACKRYPHYTLILELFAFEQLRGIARELRVLWKMDGKKKLRGNFTTSFVRTFDKLQRI